MKLKGEIAGGAQRAWDKGGELVIWGMCNEKKVRIIAFVLVGAAVAASVALRSLAAARKRIAELEEEMEACPARLVKIEGLSPGGSFDPAAAIEEHERRAWKRVEENDRRRIEREKAERER